MGLILLTKSPERRLCSLEGLKYFLKQLLGYKRGPDAVVDSLTRGLAALKIDYRLNPPAKEIRAVDIAWVNGSVEALSWALTAKAEGRIRRLAVGPIMTIMPTEKNGIMKDARIDEILFPSAWTKNAWVALAPELKNKISLWPAGTDDLGEYEKTASVYVIVYKKNLADDLDARICALLEESACKYVIVEYGKYRHAEYLELLKKATAMIVLSPSESQGMAMCEAWMHDVPTFVWNRGYMQYQGFKWYDEKISAPYLTPEAGRFFKDLKEFQQLWSWFIVNIKGFTPRKYALENFTDTISAKKFLKIVCKE
jgi:hypothetical protein